MKVGGLAVLWGNIAPDGCVVKKSAVDPSMMHHTGPARVFDSEDDAIAEIYAGHISDGDVVVIRYEGPKILWSQQRCFYRTCLPGGRNGRKYRPD